MDYHDAIKRLESYRSVQDLDGLEGTMDEISRWIDPASHDHFRVAVHTCGILNSYDFGDHTRQMALLHRYANEALDVSNLPLEEEFSLLSLLDPNFSLQSRKRYAQRWLRGLQRIAAERDANFDFNDVPALNVEPPSAAAVPAGTAPEHVSNPAARKKYEAAIEANRRKAERFNQQYRLRQLSEEFTPRAVRFIGRAYAQSPGADDELRRLLDEQEATAQIRHAIWDVVQQERGGQTL